MKIYESGEDYLETILVLGQRQGNVRSIDIANELGYSKPSVSRAVSILKREGLITIDDGGFITLTEIGAEKAAGVYERHNYISEYLVKALGVSKDSADVDACRIEHVIGQETFDRMKEWLEKEKG